MARERCPRCGGRLQVEGESWQRGSAVVERSFRCGACGSSFDSSASWPNGAPPSERARDGGRVTATVVTWVALVLLVLWFLLRTLDYGTARVAVYSAVARVAEAFLHPAWAVVLVALAVLSFLFSRRRRVPVAVSATMAPSVQLRAESPERIAVVFSDTRGAVAHDLTVTRNPGEERRIVDAFHALARRSVAFGPAEGETGWSREQIEETQRELYALGQAVGRELLGGTGGVAEALTDLPGDHLQLGVHGELAAIPWELLVARKGGGFLWQLFSVTRQLRDETRPVAPRAHGTGPLRVLLLANLESGTPGRDLPAAEREASDILELGATRPELLKIVRKSPRDARELKMLLSEGFDVLHFAGHTDAARGSERGWTLGAGETVSPADLLPGASDAPTLVFANACSSGAEGNGVGESARALMLKGVPNYLCTLAELHDAGSASFSYAFYSAVARGETLGGALTAARSALMGVHPFTWANYVLYGDPTLKLL